MWSNRTCVAVAFLTSFIIGCGQGDTKQTAQHNTNTTEALLRASVNTKLVKLDLSKYKIPLTIDVPENVKIEELSEFYPHIRIDGGIGFYLEIREGSYDLLGEKKSIVDEKILTIEKIISETPNEIVLITSFGAGLAMHFKMNITVGGKNFCAQSCRIPVEYGDLSLRCAKTIAAK
jgi:hypothetical protein